MIRARKDDTSLARYLATLVSKGDRILLVYGSGHGVDEHDVDELLEEKKVSIVRIDVHPDRMTLEEYGQKADPPAARYLLSEKLLLAGSDSATGDSPLPSAAKAGK